MADEIIRVFIIDSNVAWREAITALLTRQPDMEVVGKSADYREAISRLLASKPDVLLIDNHRSIDEERDLIIGIRRDFSDMAIVVHSQVGNPAIADLLEVGPSSFLPKGSSPRVILQTIRDARYQRDVRSSVIVS